MNPVQAHAGWLAVVAGDQPLLLPLAQCGEVHTTVLVQRLPHAKPWLLGVANLRGQIVSVVDLAAHLGLAPAAAAGDAERGPLVALPADMGVPAALLVAQLKGMRQPAALQAVDGDRPAWADGRWQDEAGLSWFSVDVARMMHHVGFIDVAA